MELAKSFVYSAMVLQLLLHFSTSHLATAQSLGKCSEVQSIDKYSQGTLQDCGDKYFEVKIDLMYVTLRDIAGLRVELICDEGHTIVLEYFYQLQSQEEVLRFSVDSVRDWKNCRLATCYQNTQDKSFTLTATSNCIVALDIDEFSNTKQLASLTWTNELTTSSLFSELISSSTTSSVSTHSTHSDESIYISNTPAGFISSSGYEQTTGPTTHTAESILSHTTESIFNSNTPLIHFPSSSSYGQTTNTIVQPSTVQQDSGTSATIINSNLATETAELPSTQTFWISIITVLSILGVAVTVTLTVVILLLQATKHCPCARDAEKVYFQEEDVLQVDDDKAFPTLTQSPSLVTIVSPLDTTIPAHNTINNRISLMEDIAAIKTTDVSEEPTSLDCQTNESTAATGVSCTHHIAPLSKPSIIYTDRTNAEHHNIILTVLPDNTTFLDSDGSSYSYDRLTYLHCYDSLKNEYV